MRLKVKDRPVERRALPCPAAIEARGTKNFPWTAWDLVDIVIETDDLQGSSWRLMKNVIVLAVVDGKEYRVVKKDQEPEVAKCLPAWKRARVPHDKDFVPCARVANLARGAGQSP